MSDLFRRRRALAVFTSAMLAVAGCAADAEHEPAPLPAPTTSGNPAAPPAARPSAPSMDDHGSVSTTYPAFTPSVAQLMNKGGRILSAPVVVSITWTDDPNVSLLESVGDTIGASDYWRDVVSEYGVGAATSGPANHVHVTTPLVFPAGPDADPVSPIVKLITDALANPAASGWPAPTDQSVYLVYIHGAAAMQLCQSGAGGLHDSVKVGDRDVPFAISAACEEKGSFTALESATISASHELAEAAVDPFPEVSPAWQGLHDDNLAWELLLMGQDENADMCEFYEDAYGKHGMPQLPFNVQRSWSNKSAAAGHAPCIPAQEAANFNVSPLAALDTVVADLAASQFPHNPRSKGYLVDVGQSRKIPLGFYSDGPTGPVELKAFEADAFGAQGDSFSPTATPNLTVTLDKTSGQNGEKTYLTVKVEKANAEKAHLVVVRSKIGAVSRYMPILIGTSGVAGGGAMSTPPAGGAKRALKKSRVFTSSPSVAAWARRLAPDPGRR